jgi:hypothetical protein
MLLWANDFRAVFWVAVIPGLMAVALLVFGLREPESQQTAKRSNPIQRENLKRLSASYWWVDDKPCMKSVFQHGDRTPCNVLIICCAMLPSGATTLAIHDSTGPLGIP